jgi:hypothetical protein
MMLLFSLALATIPLWAEGVGIDLGLEIDTGDLLQEEGDFELYVLPSVDLTLGETGFAVGASWQIPILPDVYKGILDVYGEYCFSVSVLDFTVGADLTHDLEAEEDNLGSYAYGIVDYILPFGLGLEAELDFTYIPEIALDAFAGAMYETELGPGSLGLKAELDFTYIPEIALDAIAGAMYEMELGPGSLRLEAYLNLALYEEAGLGDTEFVVSYTLPAGPVELSLEADPVLTTGEDDVELQLFVLASVIFSL